MKRLIAAIIVALCSFILCRWALTQDTGSSTTPAPNAAAQEAQTAASLDLEQLANMDVKVTSASKKSESLNQAPAAIFVLTGEDIRQGGFSSVPDALRTVPGLYVAQLDAHSWIVAARGFSSAFNDKMLVLLDGRLLYSPLFGGVYWDTVDPPLENIDRIEVIRGPGGTLWGANAVNGVINIITKSATQTQGASITTSAGIREIDRADVGYGGQVGLNFSYHVFGQSLYGNPTVDASGVSQVNPWNHNQGGVRVDWQISPKDNITFDGGGYRGAANTAEQDFASPALPGPIEVQQDIGMQGGHILGRWKHNFSDRSSTDVLAYCDWFDRFDIVGGDIRNTCDVEVQHDFSFTPRHSIIWGGSILTTVDTPSDNFEISFIPSRRRDNTYSVFAQYEVSVVADKLRFIVGSKFEHNAYTGFEAQPQIRGVWTPDHSNTLWFAVSRAVHEPARITDVDFKIGEIPDGPLPVFLAIEPNPSLKSETILAYELGYRRRVKKIFSFDLSGFYDHYGKLLELSPPGTPEVFSDYVELPLEYVNSTGGQTHGLEVFAELRPVRRWSLSGALTEIRGTSPAGVQTIVTPRHILNVQSRFDLTRRFNFDASYFYTDAIHELSLPTLNRVDVGVSTRQFSGFSFSVWGRNLQSAYHLENNSFEPYFPAGEIPRALVLKMSWQSER